MAALMVVNLNSEKKSDLEKDDPLSNSGAASIASLAEEYGINEEKLIRKIDWKILPGVTLLYLLSFLDRTNVANAKVDGLTTDLHMTGNQYLTGLTLFFIGYILFEIPCNIVLKRTSPKFWLPTLTLVWGIVATLMGVTENLAGFFVVRFFLGVSEGGLFPGIVFYLSLWYRRSERQYRICVLFSAAALAGAFGGILAYGIGFMTGVGGLHGWRWIFILEGIFTVLVALAAYYFISSFPQFSKFLTDNEKNFVQRRIEVDHDATSREGFSWRNVSQALKDPKCWLYCFAYHTMSLPLYTLSLFLPTIVKGLGYTDAQAQLLTIPPYVAATFLTVVIGTISERRKLRAPFIIASSCVAIIGYIILLANTETITTHTAATATAVATTTVTYKHPATSYGGVFLAAAGIYPAVAMVLSLPAVNVSGATKRATAGGMQITIGNLGAVIGTQLYRSNDTPKFVVGHSVALGYLCLNVLVMCVIWIVCSRENKSRDKREAAGETTVQFEGDEDVRFRFTC